MIYSEDPATAEAQMRLIEIFADSGVLPRENWRRFFPRVNRVTLICAGTAGSFEGKPDDDYCVETESGGIINPIRNVSDYPRNFQWVVKQAGLGDSVQVSVTNFHPTLDPNTCFPQPWQAYVEFEAGPMRSYAGGQAINLGSKPNYFKVEQGGFVIEPPLPYRLPYWLKDKNYLSRGY